MKNNIMTKKYTICYILAVFAVYWKRYHIWYRKRFLIMLCKKELREVQC